MPARRGGAGVPVPWRSVRSGRRRQRSGV